MISFTSCQKKDQHSEETVFDKMIKNDLVQEIKNLKTFTVDTLNFGKLNQLGIKVDYINAWIDLYIDDDKDASLSQDSRALMERLAKESPQEVDSLVKIIADNDKLFDKYPNTMASIVAYAYGLDVPSGEYSEIANRLSTMTRLIGRKSPQIEDLKPLDGINNTIVLFYDEGCGVCQSTLKDLTNNYDQLTAKGVRIVTISSDSDKDKFEENIKKYPWADKLCDYQMFNGANFKNFGVAATPTMFVMNKEGIVVNQYLKLEETGLLN